jgi:hypothetical protein
MREEKLCDSLKKLGFSRNTQIKLYGEVFQLTSDPVYVRGNFVFVDAVEKRSGRRARVRIPLNILQMVKSSQAA